MYGEEVTRRVIYAEQSGPDRLKQAIAGDINNLIAAPILKNDVKLNDIMTLVCAGNSTMVHFLLGLGPAQIRKDPYIPACTSPPPIRAAEVGILKINPRGLLYCLPSISGGVGAGITAGILATGLYEAEELTMLIDIGTK